MSPSTNPRRIVFVLALLALAGTSPGPILSVTAAVDTPNVNDDLDQMEIIVDETETEQCFNPPCYGFEQYYELNSVSQLPPVGLFKDSGLISAYRNHAFWTATNANRGSVQEEWGAMWRPFPFAEGEYQVLAFIPAMNTGSNDTVCATYEIYHGGTMDSRTINQAANVGRWVDLGKYYFEATAAQVRVNSIHGIDNFVKLLAETCSGDAGTTTVLYDAIKLVSTIAVPPTATATPAPTVRPTATNRPPATHTPLPIAYAEVTGHVTTENGKPVLIARVDLESESGQSLDTVETDESGNYRFTGVAPNQSVRIKVSLESMDGSQKICWQNTDNCKTPITASTGLVGVGATESREVNVDLTSRSLVFDAPDDEAKSLVARLATTRNYVVRVDLFRRQVLMNVSGKRVPAIIAADILIDENEPRYTTSTSPSMRRIRLGRNIITHSSYIWSWVNPRKAIYHEAFHFAMDDVMGLPAIDDLNHGGYCNVSTTDSWTEGWATFWATVVDQEDGLTATAYPPFFYNLEWRNEAFDHYNASKCPKVRGFGSYEEIAVASLLLDYADGRTLERGDRVDTDVPRLWTALVGNGTVPQNMADVYHRLGNASLTNANGTTITRRDHDDLFVSHGFFSDKNGDWDFDRDEGEQPGYTADSKRPDRRYMPLRPTANIKANWPTRPGGLHPQNVIVDVASSGSTVSYSIPVLQATGHLVPIPVPPSAENVKILLRLQYPEFTAAPYEISGWDYASLVQDADPDSDHALAIDLPATKDASPGRYSRLFFPYVSRGDDPGSLPGPAPTIVARASNTSSPTSPRTPTSSRTRTLTPSVTPTPRVVPPTLTRVATSTPTVVMPPTLTPIPTSQCNFANLTLSSTDLTVSAGSTIPICYATYCRTRVRFLDCPDGQLCRIVFEGETTGLRTCESVVAYGPASRHIAKIQIIEGGSVLAERTVPFTVQAQTMIDGRFGRFTQVNDGCSTYALQPCSGRDVILHESDDEPSGQFKNWQNKNVRVFLIRAACGSNIAGSPIMSDMVIDRIERRDTECCRSPQASIAPDRGKDSTYFVGEEIKLTLDVTCTASVRLTRCPPGAPCSVAWRADAIEDRTILLAKAEGRQSGQEKITVEVLVDNRVVSTSSTTYNIDFSIPLLCSHPGALGN